MVNLVTVPGVELMKTGTWQLSSGEWTCTPETITQAIEAHQAQVLRKPVIRLGHNDSRFTGDPAVGWLDNLRPSDDGTALLGDMVGVPQWLADIMPSAYPSRSVEGMQQYTAPDGSEHGFVLTGLALLGVTEPGVESIKSLQDVAQLYDIPDIAAAREIGGTPVQFTIEAAKGDSDEKSKHPYGDVEYADPGYQEDHVKRYPIDTAAHVRAAWSYIHQSRDGKRYTPQQLAQIKRRIAEAAKKFGITTDESTGDSDQKVEAMISDRVAKHLGIPADASDDDVISAIKRIEAAAMKASKKAADDASEREDDEKDSGADRKAAKVAASSADAVTLERGVYAELIEAARAGQRAEARQIAEDQVRIVEAAIDQGRIARSQRDHFIKLMAADPVGTPDVIASFAPGSVPMAPIGHALSDESSPEQVELQNIHNSVMANFGLRGKA